MILELRGVREREIAFDFRKPETNKWEIELDFRREKEIQFI